MQLIEFSLLLVGMLTFLWPHCMPYCELVVTMFHSFLILVVPKIIWPDLSDLTNGGCLTLIFITWWRIFGLLPPLLPLLLTLGSLKQNFLDKHETLGASILILLLREKMVFYWNLTFLDVFPEKNLVPDVDYRRMKDIHNELKDFWKKEQTATWQRSRTRKFLGDKNTPFFHALAHKGCGNPFSKYLTKAIKSSLIMS